MEPQQVEKKVLSLKGSIRPVSCPEKGQKAPPAAKVFTGDNADDFLPARKLEKEERSLGLPQSVACKFRNGGFNRKRKY